MNTDKITTEEWEVCTHVLQRISENTALINDNERLKSLIAKIHQTGKKAKRTAAGEVRREQDTVLSQSTAMVQRDLQSQSIAVAGTPQEIIGSLNREVRCYICKQFYTEIHFFYHRLCPTCAAFNYARREQRVDLTGRVALITGGRIKIGYHTALRLLRDGARVIVTTRFPQDAVSRFAKENDFAEWRDRLSIYGLDLRDLMSVEGFVEHIKAQENHLDILIHNAAQTIKRPLAFYRHLLEQEENEMQGLIAPATADGHTVPILLEARANYPALVPTTVDDAFFPAELRDADGQPIDKRQTNSWNLRLDEVSTVEMVETQLVGAVAPFLLNSKLKLLLQNSPFPRRFIINVSAMEGQFARESKTVFHPHTNMAKAALNMMTRTSAGDYAQDGIYMNSVDTGWITDENPFDKAQHTREAAGFYTPLDQIDGMARIYDPIVQGIRCPDTPLYGHFLKDYLPYPW